MRATDLAPCPPEILSAPKPELHLHLEGTIGPATLVQLAARHGQTLDLKKVRSRYDVCSFAGFLDLFKWATSYLRTPDDYALVAEKAAADLAAEHVRYAEMTLSAGVMLLRKQDVAANFRAIRHAVEKYGPRNLNIRWIFDAVRQFGPQPAMEVARLAVEIQSQGVVAFGMGGDETSIPAAKFRRVYDYIRSNGLHAVVHAGEIGEPQSIRDAIEWLGAERIGHGIAAIRDPALMDLLAERKIPLEICPTSNLRTGALAKQLGRKKARLEDHPLPLLFRRGIPVTLATDDPAMFHTTLSGEYRQAVSMGITRDEIARIAEMGYEVVFLPREQKRLLLTEFRAAIERRGLI